MVERSGNTKVVSISVTKEIDNLIKEFSLSPTDVFRKGMAVELYERNVPNYQSKLNEDRVNHIQLMKTEAISKFQSELKKIMEVIEKW